MDRPAPAADDYGLITPITLPLDGEAPGDVSGPTEYDDFFRIRHDDTTPVAWSRQALSVTRQLADDLPSTGLDETERVELLDGIALLLQHALRITVDQQ